MLNTKSIAQVRGFTMIELLIVIVIMGLLASLVAPKFFSQLSSSERGIAAAQMSAFEMALDTYRLDMGRYPSKLEELRASSDKKWGGPYLPKKIPLDPWGYPYVYSMPGEAGAPYSLKSYGADGQAGGEGPNADINHGE